MGLIRRRNRRRKPLKQSVAKAARTLLRTSWLVFEVAITVALIGAIPLGIYLGYQAVLSSNYFMVDSIITSGNAQLERAELLRLTGLDRPRNIFTVDAAATIYRLEANPWITKAHMERELPRTLRISVNERERAGWLFFNELYQIDHEGQVITVGSAQDVDGPLITGIDPNSRHEGASGAALVRQAIELARLYYERELATHDELAEIHYDRLIGFSLLTRARGMEIRLGQERFEERLERLGDVLHTLAGEDLSGRYVLLDADGPLTRVAVGPARPGRGADRSEAGQRPLR